MAKNLNHVPTKNNHKPCLSFHQLNPFQTISPSPANPQVFFSNKHTQATGAFSLMRLQRRRTVMPHALSFL
ncbi:Uncharacterized protein HZ326_20104 [Fusarium oxysporum f. sp. albedinis]|nr:Uncharacterized protein HZ326_20104 [Fusarium oxysporum f. sp. albedinis]